MKYLIKMTSGDVFIGDVQETISAESYITLKKPFSLMPVQGGFAIAPCDIALLQSEDVDSINLNTKGIQYYSELKNYPAHEHSYNEQTQTILGVEEKKIIL